ncbi:hypothetical protein [Vibrio sp.]|uniref:hypothetical protein n=1 Tax=Vibrio sp. TaxID=678 RepID=UPI0037ADD73C
MSGLHEHQLVQSITFNGEKLDLSFLRRANFIETISLDGPKLIIVFDDKESILRDDMGITEKSVMSVVLADPFNSNELDWSADWVVMTMPVDEGDNVTFNLMPKVLCDLKKPSTAGRCFVQQPVSRILQRLAPNMPHDVGVFPFKLDFHLLPAQRPSRLLRQIAKELGAVVFIRRGTLVFRTLAELQQRPAKYQYHYNDTRQQYQIAQFTLPNDESIVADLTQRCYIGWDDVKGIVKSTRHTSAPIEHTGVTSQTVLNNLTKIPITVLDANMQGNGGLQAGDCIDIVWNRSDLERPIDESLPVKVVLGTVAHSFANKIYLNRIKGVLDK